MPSRKVFLRIDTFHKTSGDECVRTEIHDDLEQPMVVTTVSVEHDWPAVAIHPSEELLEEHLSAIRYLARMAFKNFSRQQIEDSLAGEIGALSLIFTPTSEAELRLAGDSRSFNGLRLVGD